MKPGQVRGWTCCGRRWTTSRSSRTLISANNQLAKDKIALARVIGLPLDQQFELTDSAPYQPLDNLDANLSFEQAVKTRKDLQASEEQVHGAEAARKSAVRRPAAGRERCRRFRRYREPRSDTRTELTRRRDRSAVPVLQIVPGPRRAARLRTPLLDQAKARLSDQTQQVNADVGTSILDIQSAAKLVEATKSNVDLATEALSEAQQRYHAGVADNLPVSQAQTTFEQANDQYISALYQHNVAKLSLARALGVAQTNYKDYLGGK